MKPLLLSLLLVAQTDPSPTTVSDDPEPIHSLGLPTRFKPQIGGALHWDPDAAGDVTGGELQAGIYKDIASPIFGLGVLGEGFYRVADGRRPDGGARILFPIRYIGLQFGWEYSIRDDAFNSVLGLGLPLRRGGPFGRGGQLRIDWLRGDRGALNVGFSLPLAQPHLGRTRPAATSVRVPGDERLAPPEPTVDPELAAAFENVRAAAYWIDRLTVPYLDYRGTSALNDAVTAIEQHYRTAPTDHPLGPTAAATIESYHRWVRQAFAIALDDQEGERTARVVAEARELLLTGVILPYDRLLGQRKKNDTVLGLGARATAEFASWLEASSDVRPAQRPAALWIFRQLVDLLEASRARSRRLWSDSRLVWLPVQYALPQEALDSQPELNRLLELATGEAFTSGNDVHYIVNEMFQRELARHIRSAEDYHVLWVHDYKGRNYAGEPDRIAFEQTVSVYLATLTERIRALDETGRLPTYLIFIDQFFWELFDGRRWMSLLQDPLEHRVKLPKGSAAMEAEIEQAQADLRAAVAGSRTLQEGARRHGPDWLRNRVKVHVNITNPADTSFTSPHMIALFPLLPDNMMRDHRKISFFDVTEADPGRGEAIYGGMGVGEHYAGPTWSDRAILVRGPALARLKDEARALFLSQGFAEDEVPRPLRPHERPADYERRVEALVEQGWDASVMEVHNVTGYGRKESNTARAILYTTMPAKTHIYVPDSLWNSPYWSGMMVGAALRGCRVAVIEPSVDNVPVSGGLMASRANEIFAQLVFVRERLRDEMAAAGGFLAIGIYDTETEVGDVVQKLRTFRDGVARQPEFRRLFPFDRSVYDLFARAPEVLEEAGYAAEYLVDDVTDRKPKLHLKAQFFAAGDPLDRLLRMPEWEPIVRAYLLARVEQTSRRNEGKDARDLRQALAETGVDLGERFYSSLTPEEREQVFFFLAVGSHNLDYRGMIMDGEATVLVGSDDAMIAFLDFLGIIGLTEWIDDLDELETMLPRHNLLVREFARFVKYAL